MATSSKAVATEEQKMEELHAMALKMDKRREQENPLPSSLCLYPLKRIWENILELFVSNDAVLSSYKPFIGLVSLLTL
jgi:hypothetical protein